MYIELRKATEKDKTYLMSLRLLTMSQHLENAGLVLSPEGHAFRLNDGFEHIYLLVHENLVVGMLKYCEHADHVEIMQVQVHPDHQGKGIGGGVIQQVLTLAGSKSVKLTVLKNNPAVSLYKRLGFTIVGEDDYEFHMQT